MSGAAAAAEKAAAAAAKAAAAQAAEDAAVEKLISQLRDGGVHKAFAEVRRSHTPVLLHQATQARACARPTD